jgi:chromate transporter
LANETVNNSPAKFNLRLFFSLFGVFFKIGAFTWGGGYAMIPIIKSEIVDKRGWIKSEAFIDGIAVAQSLPGTMAVNTAAFVGDKMMGNAGVLASTLGAVLPSFVTILVIAIFFVQFREFTPVQYFFKGATPAIAALLVSAVFDMGKVALKHVLEIVIAAAFFILLVFFNVHPIIIILGGGILGIFTERRSH